MSLPSGGCIGRSHGFGGCTCVHCLRQFACLPCLDMELELELELVVVLIVCYMIVTSKAITYMQKLQNL